MCIKHPIFIVLVVAVSLAQCISTNNSHHRKGKVDESRGRSLVQTLCPSKMKLNCANVMYSKQCNYNYDCSYVGPRMFCCETGCSGNSKYMCVPEENHQCPYLQPAYYTGMKKCRVETDCDQGFICCLNIAGEGYCHKPTSVK